MAAAGEDVYCTLCLSDSYLPGAAVLAKSLRDAGTQKKLACLVVSTYLRHSVILELQSLYNYVIPVEPIGNPHPANLYLMGRPELQFMFTKLHLWNLTQFRKIVYLDADVVALRAPDELFDLPDAFAAAPDVGWPDAFNSGVMVLSPDRGEYAGLRTMASEGNSFDGADQGLLNQYFEHRPWKRLSFTYNCTPSGYYQYEPAYRHYKRDISMVHFIGPEKPWQRGRVAGGAPGSFQELLTRWWMVYDRHFGIPTNDYIYGERQPEQSRVIQERVREYGAPTPQEPAYYATGYPVDYTEPAPPSEAPVMVAEEPFTDREEVTESLDKGHTEPQPTVEVRRFSAPHMEWDATRSEPPPQSRAEAGQLEVQNYEFNNDPQPFRPPPSYPEPPKDMWYQVPQTPTKKKEEKLAPIFPWEQHARPAATRRFVDDLPEPTPEPEEPSFMGSDELEVHMDEKPEPQTPAMRLTDEITWTAFGTINKNAWDEVSGIESYVRALTAYQKQRGKPRPTQSALSPADPTVGVPAAALPAATAAIALATAPGKIDPKKLVEQVQKRRESLILTDFPSAVDRPSLPVTPAPVRRTIFWGGEKSDGDEDADPLTTQMPPAHGVPQQVDWDPIIQLETLRRNSLLVSPDDLQLPAGKVHPARILPESSSSSAAKNATELAIGAVGGLVIAAAGATAVVGSTAAADLSNGPRDTEPKDESDLRSRDNASSTLVAAIKQDADANPPSSLPSQPVHEPMVDESSADPGAIEPSDRKWLSGRDEEALADGNRGLGLDGALDSAYDRQRAPVRSGTGIAFAEPVYDAPHASTPAKTPVGSHPSASLPKEEVPSSGPTTAPTIRVDEPSIPNSSAVPPSAPQPGSRKSPIWIVENPGQSEDKTVPTTLDTAAYRETTDPDTTPSKITDTVDDQMGGDEESQISDMEEFERREFERREKAEADALADREEEEEQIRRGSGMFRSWKGND